MNTRMIILKILEEYEKRPWGLEHIVDRELDLAPIDHRDRRFIFEIVYGVIRRRLTLDYVIDRYLSDPGLAKNPHLRRVLQMGAYQILFMDRVPDHAAVNESVECAHLDMRVKTMSGVVNGVLRTVVKEKKRALAVGPQKSLQERLSIEFSHPQWMLSRWLARLGLARTKALLAFNNQRPEIYLRRKIRGLSRGQFESESRDFCVAPPVGYRNLFYRFSKQLPPDMFDLFKEGRCTVQTPSSGWMVAMLDVQKGQRVLDLCSAPGGKSALIAELAGDEGRVYACEIKWNRMQLTAGAIRRMGLPNVKMVLCDGAQPPFSALFSKVLLDAPCTGSGVLQRHPEGRWLKSEEDIGRLVLTQQKLLNAAADIVAPGGILVYSTCSLEPEENELCIEAFLKAHPEFVLDGLPAAIPASYIDGGYVRITPYEHKLDGMFGARLRKRSQGNGR